MAINIKKVLKVPHSLDEKSVDALVKAIKNNYIKDFDYIKFIYSVQNLMNMGVDEATAFKSAYTTAQTMGFTAEEFENSSRHYKTVLSKENERFSEALKRQRQEKISNRVEDKQKIKHRIEENENEIEKLTKENELLRMRYEKFEETLQAEKDKLQEITKDFVESYNHLSEKIENDIHLFKTYIN